MQRTFGALALTAVVLSASPTHGAELVRIVKAKISAGDLLSATAAAEDHRSTTGADAEYLDAVGWLARGAQMFGREELARQYVAELRRAIPRETDELIVPLGAAIEVEAKLLAAREGRGAALRFLDAERTRANAIALRSRIRKNMNLLSLEGESAPPIEGYRFERPTLLYFFAEWCGDCKAQAVSLARIWRTYRSRGLDMIAVTRLYGGTTSKPLTAEDERRQIEKVWKETYAELEGVPVVVDTEAMVRYGVSATPTFVLIDGKGVVRLYTPTRLSESALVRAVEDLLANR